MDESILRNVPLFAGLPPPALATLAARLRRRHMAANTPVVYRGDPAGALYIIVAGSVKVHTATCGGDEVILGILRAGDFFGEMSLLDGQPRAADVTTLEAADLALLDGGALRQAIQEQPGIAMTLLRVLSERTREQNGKLEELMTLDVTGRVAGLLLRLAATQGRDISGGVRIDVKLSQTDIANFVGATRERANRVLTGFRRQKWVMLDATGHWVVSNKDALASRAEML